MNHYELSIPCHMNNFFDQLAETWEQNPAIIERARVTADYCKGIAFHDKKHLLDFGGGTGLLSLFLKDEFGAITIVDTSKEMLKVAREKIDKAEIKNVKTLLLNEDISEIAGTYSAVIALMTLHHIVDIDHFLKSIFMILDEYGVLIIADLYTEDGSFHKNISGYKGHNGFDIDRLSDKLTRAGFRVTQASKYFEIKKENSSGKEQIYPLFFLTAEKTVD